MYLRVLFYVLLHTLFSCTSPTGGEIETLTPPVIIVLKSDSAIVVKDAEGKQYKLNTSDRIDYRAHFLKIGDTLN